MASTLLLLLVVLSQGSSSNPLEEVDPGATLVGQTPLPPLQKQRVEEPRPVETAKEPVEVPKPPPVTSPTQAVRPSPTPAPVEPPAEPRPAPAPRGSDADFQAAWEKWRKAVSIRDFPAASEAETALLSLKDRLGVADLELFSVAFARESEKRLRAKDGFGATNLAWGAVKLAPHLPFAHFMLARARFASDPVSPGAYLSEFTAGLRAVLEHPRYRGPFWADLGFGTLFALLATTLVAIVVLFLARARLFFHDFHHLFPRVTARWQSAICALILLAVPIAFRLGVLPAVLLLWAVVALYLSIRERVVVGVLVSLCGAIPLLAGGLVNDAAFAGTLAEEVFQLETGGFDAQAAVAAVRRRSDEGTAGFAETYALARYELRRGHLDGAIEYFKRAAGKRGAPSGALLTNLGNAMLFGGNEDGALEAYAQAIAAAPSLAAPQFNTAVVQYRRAARLSYQEAAQSVEKGRAAWEAAVALDRSLDGLKPSGEVTELQRAVLSPALPAEEIRKLRGDSERAREVEAQLERVLFGTSALDVWRYLPLLFSALIIGFSFLGGTLGASGACDKCGQSACRKCDPELPMGSVLCAQCNNAFVKSNVVTTAVKLKKQFEIEIARRRRHRVAYLLGLALSGAGHLFSGMTIRGALILFGFAAVAFQIVFFRGVVPAPFGLIPVAVRLIPLGVAIAALWGLSLWSLRRKLAR